MFTIISYGSTFTYNANTQELFWGSKFVGYADNLEAAKWLADDQCEIEIFEFFDYDLPSGKILDDIIEMFPF